MIYQFNAGAIAAMLLPPALRAPCMKAWLKCLLAPLQSLNDEACGRYYKELTHRMSLNGVTLVMQEHLNRTFDIVAEPKIKVVQDVVFRDIQYVFNKEEQQLPIYLSNSPAYLGIFTDYEPEYDFEIKAPAAWSGSQGSYTLAQQQTYIAAEVDKLRPAGTRYRVSAW